MFVWCFCELERFILIVLSFFFSIWLFCFRVFFCVCKEVIIFGVLVWFLVFERWMVSFWMCFFRFNMFFLLFFNILFLLFIWVCSWVFELRVCCSCFLSWLFLFFRFFKFFLRSLVLILFLLVDWMMVFCFMIMEDLNDGVDFKLIICFWVFRSLFCSFWFLFLLILLVMFSFVIFCFKLIFFLLRCLVLLWLLLFLFFSNVVCLLEDW